MGLKRIKDAVGGNEWQGGNLRSCEGKWHGDREKRSVDTCERPECDLKGL